MENEEKIAKQQIAYHVARKAFVEADKAVWRLGDALRQGARVLSPEPQMQGKFWSAISPEHKAIEGLPSKEEIVNAVRARTDLADAMFDCWFDLPEDRRDECNPLPLKLSHKDGVEMARLRGAKE